ncbi:ORF6N domain-containing protein [Loktanella atrilutea]|uniref:ORF6N domain-containing protein n=1 Tax=Loktanella atrilutea TaxID=366533 RepID=A0A1M5BQ04_LOKAT|nr:ORF6N domain-containing protein [Loktanella atrilutea]SHF44579.1 ORF6N domain-containing protein [Loktanella atrilutea]
MTDDLAAGVARAIFRLRGVAVILDADVAAIFGRTTSAVNQHRSRNAGRFLDDYAFQLTPDEWDDLKSQNVISSAHGGRRGRPWAYSEQGFIMLATGFRGPEADRIARTVAETFVAYRRGELPMERVFDKSDKGLRNSLRSQLSDMLSAIASMPMPGGSTVLEELDQTTQAALGRVRAWMDQPGKQNTKLDAEIAKLAADTQRAYAEVRRTDAETANLWADTVLKRLDAVRQLRLMVQQIERDDLSGLLDESFGQAVPLAVLPLKDDDR